MYLSRASEASFKNSVHFPAARSIIQDNVQFPVSEASYKTTYISLHQKHHTRQCTFPCIRSITQDNVHVPTSEASQLASILHFNIPIFVANNSYHSRRWFTFAAIEATETEGVGSITCAGHGNDTQHKLKEGKERYHDVDSHTTSLQGWKGKR